MSGHRDYTVETIRPAGFCRPAVVKVVCECGEGFAASSRSGVTDDDPRGVLAGMKLVEATQAALDLYHRVHEATNAQLSLFSV